MSIMTQATLSLFPLIILLIIYTDNRKHQIISPGDRSFDILVIVVFFSIVTYFTSYLPPTWAVKSAVAIDWVLNGLYLTVSVGIGLMQLKYTVTRVNPSQKKMPLLNKFTLHIPYIVCVAFIVTSYYTKAVFYISDANEYCRGALYWIPYACNAFYVFVGILLCVRGYFTSPAAEVVSDCKMLLAASSLAMIGMALQLLPYDLWLSLPITALSVFYMYVSVQNQRITVDSLTGLNNRRELSRLLDYRTRHKEAFTVVLVDLDGFKAINDTYGHTAGDEALRRFADVLRESFSRSGYFYSRCGGDEFAFILPTYTDEAAKMFISELNAAVRASCAKSEAKYRLAFSAGYAVRNSDASGDWQELYTLADKRMYAEKNMRKCESMNGGGGAKL